MQQTSYAERLLSLLNSKGVTIDTPTTEGSGESLYQALLSLVSECERSQTPVDLQNAKDALATWEQLHSRRLETAS